MADKSPEDQAKYIIRCLGDEEYNARLQELKKCESGIEMMFLAELNYRGISAGMVKQKRIANYRVDFLLRWSAIVIETDGHAFHNRTPEQVTRDNIRDRALQRMGYMVLRFNYQEITRDLEQCVDEVIDTHFDTLEKFQHEAMKRQVSIYALTQPSNQGDVLEGYRLASVAEGQEVVLRGTNTASG